MDYFSVCFDAVCLAAQSIMHIAFISRLTGKKERLWNFAVYFFLLCLIELVFHQLDFIGNFGIGVQAFVLYGISCLIFKNRRSVSWTAAVLAIYISQLSYGIVNSVQGVILPRMIGTMLLYVLLILAAAVSFMICVCCYMIVLRLLSLEEGAKAPHIALLLFPGMFFLMTELYVLRTAYSRVHFSVSPAEYREHITLLFLQLLGLLAFFCMLYAYRRICRSFQAQAELDSLAQAVETQKIYISEAQTRYERTKAFRHDIKNHLTVLGGLLEGGEMSKAKIYLHKLEMAAAALSFLYQTGNPVVDILMSEKLGAAEDNGIAAEVSLIFPKQCTIDDFDLCVIFANALDNAVRACRLTSGERYISVRGEQQGDYYMIEFENSCLPETVLQEGTGLLNIRAVAEKYHGAMVTEKKGVRFFLNVLLDISCC